MRTMAKAVYSIFEYLENGEPLKSCEPIRVRVIQMPSFRWFLGFKLLYRRNIRQICMDCLGFLFYRALQVF